MCGRDMRKIPDSKYATQIKKNEVMVLRKQHTIFAQRNSSKAFRVLVLCTHLAYGLCDNFHSLCLIASLFVFHANALSDMHTHTQCEVSMFLYIVVR